MPLPAVGSGCPDTAHAVTGNSISADELHFYPGGAPLPARGGQPCPPGISLIDLPDAETARIERLARDWKAGLISRARLAFRLRWSHWCRRHQARACTTCCTYVCTEGSLQQSLRAGRIGADSKPA